MCVGEGTMDIVHEGFVLEEGGLEARAGVSRPDLVGRRESDERRVLDFRVGFWTSGQDSCVGFFRPLIGLNRMKYGPYGVP